MIAGTATLIAVLLGMLGLYGVLSDADRQRARELAIQIALGARRRHVLLEGCKLACAGAVSSLAASILLARLFVSFAPPDYSPDLSVWLAGPAALFVAALIAGVLPAHSAPVTAGEQLAPLRNDARVVQ